MHGMTKLEKRLTARQESFCVYHARGGKDASEAYRLAYSARNMKSTTVNRNASKLMANPRVRARVEALRKEVADRSVMDAAEVLNHWVKIATADPNDIIQARRTCCRHCYGTDHAYQWTAPEYALECAKAIQMGKATPDGAGGTGFNHTLDSYPYCPVCFGEGVSSVYVADTRKLKGNAKLLYAGVKRTKHGVEIVMRNQDQALENIAKYLGMYKDKLATPIGTPGAPLVAISALTQNPVEASKLYQQLMQDSK